MDEFCLDLSLIPKTSYGVYVNIFQNLKEKKNTKQRPQNTAGPKHFS